MTSLLDFSFISHTDSGANLSSKSRGQAHGDGSTASSGAASKEEFQALMDRQSPQTEAFYPQTITESFVDKRHYRTGMHGIEGEMPSVTTHIPDLTIEIEDSTKVNPADDFKTAVPPIELETSTVSILVTAPNKEPHTSMDGQSAQTKAFDPQTITESFVDRRHYRTGTHSVEGEIPSVTTHIPDLTIEIEDSAKVNPAAEFKTTVPSIKLETSTESILVTAPSKEFHTLMDGQSAQRKAFEPQTITESFVDKRHYRTGMHGIEGEIPSVTTHIPDLTIEIEDSTQVNPASEFMTAASDDLTQTASVEGVDIKAAKESFAPEKPVQPILIVAPEGLLPENLPNEVPDDLRALDSFNSGKPVDPILVTSPVDFTPDTPVERIPKISVDPINKAAVSQMSDVKTDAAAPANLTPSSAFTPEAPITPILVVAPEGLLNPTSPNATPVNALTIENLKFVPGSSPVVGAANPSRDMLEAESSLNSPGKILTQGELLTNLPKVEPVLLPGGRFDVANFQGLNENPTSTTTSTTVQLTPALGPTVSTLPPVQYFAPVTTTPAQIIAAQPAQIGQIIVEATLQQERTIIRIDPPELGRIQLDFDHSTSGRTTILLSAETEAARQILAEKRAFMMTLFESYGLDDVEIKLQRPETTAFSKQEGALNFSDRQAPSRQEYEAKQLNPSADLGQGHLETSQQTFSDNNTYRREAGAERLHIRV